MAVTKIWPVRGRTANALDYVSNPEKTVQELPEDRIEDMMDVLNYADDETKTEKHMYSTGINCDRDTAAEDFNLIKMRYQRFDERVCYHGYQSFSKGEGTPEIVHEIGVRLAKELWGDRFQVLVCTHLNTECLHNHFVINSVSFVDGKMLHSSRASYHKMKEVSDRLCKEYGLSIVEKPKGRRVPMELYKMEQAGMPTRYNVARKTIDEAIAVSVNMKEFEAELKRQGYTFRFLPNRKYWTITPPGWTKPIRINKLGEDYTKERIQERVYANDVSVRTEAFAKRYKQKNSYNLTRRVHKIMGRSGLEKLYLRYCYELGYLPKYTQNTKRLHRALKEDLLKCELYSEEAKLLSKYSIASEEDLFSFMDKEIGKINSVSEERDELRKLIKRRTVPEEEKEVIKGRIASLTDELKSIRRELKVCEDIKERSKDIEKNLEVISKERNIDKEVNRV